MKRLAGDLIKSSAITGLATIALAWQGIISEDERNGLIVGAALLVGFFDVVAGFVLLRKDNSRRRLEGAIRDHLEDLTLSVSALAADRPQDWAAEMLLARKRWLRQGVDSVRPKRVVFHRLGLGQVLAADAQTRAGSPAQQCLAQRADVLWSAVELPSKSANFADTCTAAVSEAIAVGAGACRCTLVMDRNESAVVGVLVLYLVAETPEMIVGVMEQRKFAEAHRRSAKAIGRVMTED